MTVPGVLAECDPAGAGPSLLPPGGDPDPELRHAVYRMVFRGADLREPGDPAARGQVAHLAALLAARPGPRTPAPEIVTALPPRPGQVLASRAVDGSSLMVWTTAGTAFTVATDALAGPRARGWWFDPRTGDAIDMGSVRQGPEVEVHPPTTGCADAGLDWVLVVDDAGNAFGSPSAAGTPPPA